MSAAQPPYVQKAEGGFRLLVHVQPGAGRDEVAGEHGGRLKVRLKAPPVDGKANKALIAFLARLLDMKKNDLRLVGGETDRRKTLFVAADRDVAWDRALTMQP